MDIRNAEMVTGEEVRALNFINASPSHHFRRYFRQGLRSHIFEVLDAGDVLKETRGEVMSGVRWFPRAVPRKILRILRTRFDSLGQVLDEVRKYALVLETLGPELIAVSQEFIVEYTGAGRSEIVLCGLQEYVRGKVLDPWSLYGDIPLNAFYKAHFSGEVSEKSWMTRAGDAVEAFVRRTRKMVMENGYIPDLAGNGNLILTPRGDLKLVDINNIIVVHCDDAILLDDKKYPSCDKSVEVLAILEQKILKNKNLLDDDLYGHFLTEERRTRVRQIEEVFYERHNNGWCHGTEE